MLLGIRQSHYLSPCGTRGDGKSAFRADEGSNDNRNAESDQILLEERRMKTQVHIMYLTGQRHCD